MHTDHIKDELPPQFEELKKAANRTANWRERLKAAEALGQWNNRQTITILKHLAANDAVYKVQEAAYRKLKQLGEDVPAPALKKGEPIKGVNKILLRIKKSLPEGHTFEQFKDKLKRTRIDVYDTYEGDKGADFDQWLEAAWASLTDRTI